MKQKLLIIALTFLYAGCQTQEDINSLTSFGDIEEPQIFAPEITMRGNTYKGSFSDDYNTFYFFREDENNPEKYAPFQSKYQNGKWSEPTVAEYYAQGNSYTYNLNVPRADMLIFLSDLRTKFDTSTKPNYNFWYVLKSEEGWSTPKELGPRKLISNYDSQPGITNKGTIYFSSFTPDWCEQIPYRMERMDGEYSEPEPFEPVNKWRTNMDWRVGPYAMDPDEKYQIVTLRDIKNGNFDLYISYFENNVWTDPQKLDNSINTPQEEGFPYLTANGKYLMFTRNRSQFYIVSTKKIRAKPDRRGAIIESTRAHKIKQL